MDVWSFATCVMLNLLCAGALEVTVNSSNLTLCKNGIKVCVVDRQDCETRPPPPNQESPNITCYFKVVEKSVTCAWNESSRSSVKPQISLFFRKNGLIYCPGILNPAATVNITARMISSMTGEETWSRPLELFLYNAVKPPRPVLKVLGSTANSFNVTWTSTGDGGCQLRYRASGTHTWTQSADMLPKHENQVLTYSIRGLLPFTRYEAAAACRGVSIWSEWSFQVTVTTPEMAPSRPVEVCYTVEKTEAGGSFYLHLMWQDSNLCDPGGHVLGYEVSYRPDREKQREETLKRNVTNVAVLLDASEGNYSITVRAFNTAGYGPAAQLHIDAHTQNPLPPVRNLWVSSDFPITNAFRVRWQDPSGPPVSHLYVQWYPETRPSAGCWITADSRNSSALIGDVDGGAYLISVTPVYGQRCGPSRTLPASLSRGALMEAVQMKLLGVTKTTVTVGWVWQRKSTPTKVKGYQLMLRRGSETQTMSLKPDQQQHTFYDLKPNAEYYLLLLADNVSRHTAFVKTGFDEVPVVAAATPLLLLAAGVLVLSLLSRTVCKSQFFPTISSPWSSKTAHWLKNPPPQKPLDRKVLNIEDFRVVDVLGDKGLLLVGPRPKRSSTEDLREDASPLMHTVKLDSVCVSELVLRENNDHSGFLCKLKENSLSPFLEESCPDPDFHELLTNQSTHMTCETEYIFVEQISSALKE